MKKTALKLHEFYTLEAELNGVINQQTGEQVSKGLIFETKKMTTKYWLSDLSKRVTAEKQAVESLKEDLIKKHGEPDVTGAISIPMYINVVTNEQGEVTSREVNPKFVQFQNDFNSVLEETKELEHKEFKLKDFEDVEAGGFYNVFFKLVEPTEE